MECSRCGHTIRNGKIDHKIWHIFARMHSDTHNIDYRKYNSYCGRRWGPFKAYDIGVSNAGPYADMCEACWIELNKRMPQAHAVIHRAWVEEGEEPLFLFTKPVPRLTAIITAGLTPIGEPGMPKVHKEVSP